jgi:hypothetical protein
MPPDRKQARSYSIPSSNAMQITQIYRFGLAKTRLSPANALALGQKAGA